MNHSKISLVVYVLILISNQGEAASETGKWCFKRLSCMYINRVQATSVTDVKIVTARLNSTSGKMVTHQQDQLDETGYLGSATPYCQTKVRLMINLVLY